MTKQKINFGKVNFKSNKDEVNNNYNRGDRVVSIKFELEVWTRFVKIEHGSQAR